MKLKSGAETVTCTFCHRRNIVVDRTTGRRAPHFRKSGRKGGRCAGSERHIDTRPEAHA